MMHMMLLSIATRAMASTLSMPWKRLRRLPHAAAHETQTWQSVPGISRSKSS